MKDDRAIYSQISEAAEEKDLDLDNIMPFMYVCIILTCCVSSLFSFFLEDTHIPWTWYFRCLNSVVPFELIDCDPVCISF